MIRKILAVLLGAIVGSVFNMALISLSHVIYPLPEGIDPNDFEAFRAHVEANGLPTGALMIVLAAHAGGSFVSGFVCGVIAQRSWYLAAAILGILWTCGGIAMLGHIGVYGPVLYWLEGAYLALSVDHEA